MKLDHRTDFNINGEKLKICVILPYFNESLGKELLENVQETLRENQVKEENIRIIRVAGSLEIPFACQKTIKRDKPDAIITLAVIIRGETSHYDLVTETTHQGIMDLQLKYETPIAFGIIAAENLDQAKIRCSKSGLNKGREAAIAALIQTQI